MKIAICVKWVPVVSRMQFDVEAKRIIREGVPNEVSPYDLLALQRAVELKAERDVEVTVYTMGPPGARQGLVQCLAMGADRAFHINDAALAGSDTLATSRALSLALGREAYDLILFGYHSTDAETGQVGPEVAELMGLPQVTGVRKLDVADAGLLRLERHLEDGFEVVEVRMPAVLSVTEGVAPETFAGRDALKAAMEREIPEISAKELSEDLSLFGMDGSPTWVQEIRILESEREQLMLQDIPVAEAAKRTVEFLKGRGHLDPTKRGLRRAGQPIPATVRPEDGPDVWVVADVGPAGVRSVTHELLGAAQPVADAVQGHVVALLFGGPDAGQYADELAHYGADMVAVAADAALAAYTTEAYAAALAAVMREWQPYAVLLPSTVNGRDLAGRVAARLGLGLTGDCVGLEVDEEQRLVQLKPAFGGNVVAPILSKTKPYMATVRPGLLERPVPDTSRKAPVRTLKVQAPGDPAVRVVESHREVESGAVEIDDAWAVIGVGMGVGGPEHIAALDPLAELLDAQYVCTRDVADAGWMPKQLQVGLTGRSVAPDLYIGVGVRGDFNHTVGIRRAGTIVGVNNNPRATIFRQADLGVLADWNEFVPALVQTLRAELG